MTVSGQTEDTSEGFYVASPETIAHAESHVGAALTSLAADALALLDDLTSFAGRLLLRIEEHTGEPTAVHAVAIIAARVVTEARAAGHLIRLGYPAQALTLTGTMLELMHSAAYIGTDPARAAAWFAHDDPKRTYPPRLKDAIHELARRLGIPEAAASREYDEVYRQICMVKHGNPMAIGSTSVVSTEEALQIVAGPHLSPEMERIALTAAQYVLRYTLLTLTLYLGLIPEPVRKEHLPELHGFEERHAAFVRAGAQRLGADVAGATGA